jgi:hypothetical protein
MVDDGNITTADLESIALKNALVENLVVSS